MFVEDADGDLCSSNFGKDRSRQFLQDSPLMFSVVSMGPVHFSIPICVTQPWNAKGILPAELGCGCSLCAQCRIGVLAVTSKAGSSAVSRSVWAQQTRQGPHPAPGHAWPPVHGIGATVPPCRRSACRSIDSVSEPSAVQCHCAMGNDAAFLPLHFGALFARWDHGAGGKNALHVRRTRTLLPSHRRCSGLSGL